MFSRSLLLTLGLSIYPKLISTAPFLEQRGNNVCQSGIYGDLVPLLISFEPAQVFCTAVYPVQCTTKAAKRGAATSSTTSKNTHTSTTTTKTTTSCTTTPKTTPLSTTTTKVSTTTPKTTTSTVDAKSSAWSKCQQQPWNVISTLCSCIEVPKSCTVTTSKASSTTTKQTSSTTTSSKTTSSATTSSTRRSTTSSTTSTTSRTTTSSSSMTTTSSTTTSSSTTSSTASPTTTSTSSSTTTSSTVTTTTTTSSNAPVITDCTQLVPASTGVYLAPNADTFYLECGAYFQEDDTDAYANSLNGDGGDTNVDGFRGCLDLCSTTAGCNYISFYEQTSLCHLLSGLFSGPYAAPGGTYAGYDRASLQVST